MRLLVACFAGILLATGLLAQRPKEEAPPPVRYGVEPDLESFPQGTPQEALGSVVNVIQRRRLPYLLAQLADPEWVDERVKSVHGGRFGAMVKETEDQLVRQPRTLTDLQTVLKDGTWKEADDTAEGQAKGVDDHVFLRHIGKRWYLENRKR